MGQAWHFAELMSQILSKAAAHLLGNALDIALVNAQCFSYITHRTCIAILDKSADHCRVFRFVFIEDVAKHLSPRFTAKVQVHVWYIRCGPILTEEALDLEVIFNRIDIRKPEQITDH
jgi:hypothetical protein